jgi:hypothetical protein
MPSPARAQEEEEAEHKPRKKDFCFDLRHRLFDLRHSSQTKKGDIGNAVSFQLNAYEQ